MIKACWKCKGPVDTQAVDVTETVGLCAKCFERFDEEPKPEKVVEVPANSGLVGTSGPPAIQGFAGSDIGGVHTITTVGYGPGVTGTKTAPGGFPTGTIIGISSISGIDFGADALKPMSGQEASRAAEEAIKQLPQDMSPGELQAARRKIFEVLQVPEEYIKLPEKPNVPPMMEALMLLQDLISAEVKRVENNLGDQVELDRVKVELRAASIKILKEVAPAGVQLSHIERVVDSALADAFGPNPSDLVTASPG